MLNFLKRVLGLSRSEPTHFYSDGKTLYDVHKLIKLTSKEPIVMMSVAELRRHLMDECWTDDRGQRLTPIALLDSFTSLGDWHAVAQNNIWWGSHVLQVIRADCKYPLLMCGNVLVDGLHRLVRATSEGVEKLPVRVLSQLPDRARCKE